PPSAPSPWPAERPPDSLSAGSAPVTRMEEVERQAYVEALERFEGNVSRAAQALGVSRGTFYNKMRRHGIEARSQVRQSTPPKGSSLQRITPAPPTGCSRAGQEPRPRTLAVQELGSTPRRDRQ